MSIEFGSTITIRPRVNVKLIPKFNHVTIVGVVKHDMVKGLLLGIYPVYINTFTNTVYAMGSDHKYGTRLFGLDYWNQYSVQSLLVSVINASQLGNNYKGFIDEVVENTLLQKTPVN